MGTLGPDPGCSQSRHVMDGGAPHATPTAECPRARFDVLLPRAALRARGGQATDEGAGDELRTQVEPTLNPTDEQSTGSRSHDLAATHISKAQIDRIFATADEFVAGEPKGLLTDMRIDLALVDGQGRIEIVENAFAG